MNFTLFNKILSIFLIFGTVFLIYLFSNPKLKTHYQHQVYLAFSLTKGHFDLIKYPSYYHDIFKIKEKMHTAFTPFPVLILTPLVLIFSLKINQFLISVFIGSLSPFLLYLILKKLSLSSKTIFLTLIGFSLGTLNWYSSTIATSWFFSHTLAVTTLLFSLFFLFKKLPFWGGLFFGFSFASRYPVLASLPAIFWLLKYFFPQNWRKKCLVFILGILPGLILVLIYNYGRFGHILKTGYYYANLTYANNSLSPFFSFRYFPKNLYIFLFKGYNFISRFPFLKPDPQGLSIFFTSPFLLYSLKAKGNKKLIFALWLAVICISLLVFSYFLTGWFQFGYRFSLDFLPFLIILTALGLEKSKSTLIKYFLIGASILFNLLGVYWGLTLKW